MRKEEGVSPVIAEILMIAITVILVTSVYYLITSGIVSTPYGSNQLNGALIVDYSKSNSSAIYFNVVLSYPSNTQLSKVKITILRHNGDVAHLNYTNNLIWSNATSDSKWHYEAKLMDNDGDGKFSHLDSLVIYIKDDNPSDSTLPPKFESGDKVVFYIEGFNGISSGGIINF